jgi:hypothetical protein
MLNIKPSSHPCVITELFLLFLQGAGFIFRSTLFWFVTIEKYSLCFLILTLWIIGSKHESKHGEKEPRWANCNSNPKKNHAQNYGTERNFNGTESMIPPRWRLRSDQAKALVPETRSRVGYHFNYVARASTLLCSDWSRCTRGRTQLLFVSRPVLTL